MILWLRNIFVITSYSIHYTKLYEGSEKLGHAGIPDTKPGMQAAAAVGQPELISCYQSYFDDYNQVIAQVLITSDIVDYSERIENTRNTFV